MEDHYEISNLQEFAAIAGDMKRVWSLLINKNVKGSLGSGKVVGLRGESWAAIFVDVRGSFYDGAFSNFEYVEIEHRYHINHFTYTFYHIFPSISMKDIQDAITGELKQKEKKSLREKIVKILSEYSFNEADSFYQTECKNHISESKYQSWKQPFVDELKKKTLRERTNKLLFEYSFNEADSFYQAECKNHISESEYQSWKQPFVDELKQKEKKSLRERINKLLSEYSFNEADSFYQAECKNHISESEYQSWKQPFVDELKQKRKADMIEQIDRYLNLSFNEANKLYRTKFKNYVDLEEYKCKKQKFVQSWIEENLGNKPDLEQSLAIGLVNSHVQVIARAGSGKTSTLVNRAIFLQKHCGIKPSEILLLAFNKKAVEEIRERLQKHLQENIPHVMTFHALAYHLVHPSEDLIVDAEGNQSKSRSLQNVIDEYLRKPNYFGEIKSLMMKRFRSDWEMLAERGFDLTLEEMIEYRRSLTKMGIDGWSYKSGGEKVIADFLFEHDISFKYERNFWWNGVNYHPDFTVFFSSDNPKKGVVIEYFGMQGDPEYDELSDKKREYWQNQSDYLFVELDPQILKQQGRKAMEDHLHYILREQIGFQFTRLSDREIWEKIKERAIDRFTNAMTQFIGRCRKLCLTPNQLSEMIDRHDFDPNSEIDEIEYQFLQLAQDFYVSYLDRLQQTGEEDFDGLMQRAAKTVNEGNTEFLSSKNKGDLRNLKYIMIDEYQDFSLLFHNLITAIRIHNHQALFFCVGDDWQAINGFAGADLYYYQNFKEIFQHSHILPITTNYRSGAKIVDSGNKLMLNKGIPAKPSTQNQGKIQLVDIGKFRMTPFEEQEHGYDLTAAVIRLVGKLIQEGKQVALLSHKNYLQKVDTKISDLENFRKYILQKLNLVGEMEKLVDISTTHKYKGKERQVVIILDAYSYPSIHQDHIFNRVFGEHIEKLIEDERRLFYVALTRAKEHLFIITDNFRISPFVKEITSQMQLEKISWKEYPVALTERRFITIKVGNQKGRSSSPTVAIKDNLKAEGYKYNGDSKCWCKVEPIQRFMPDESRLQFLSSSSWSTQTDGIEVTFYDEQEEVLASYSANNGKWIGSFDKFNTLNDTSTPEQNIGEYDDIS